MGSQPLNDRNTRRLSRQTGLNIVRAVSHGGTHWLSIITAEHRHGSYHPRTGKIEWDNPADTTHFTSCVRLFPP